MNKILKYLALIFGAVLLIVLITINIIGDFRKSDNAVMQWFSRENLPIDIINSSWEGKKVRYVKSSNRKESKDQLVVFVHGAPGASDNFFPYLADQRLLDKADLISIDRLGYGFSNYGIPASIEEQSDFLHWILEKEAYNKVLLVGHSYGGPIVAKCAVDYYPKVDHVLMLAPVIDPNNEKIFWFSYPCKWKATRWLFPKAVRVAVTEKFAHAEELRLMEKDWQRLKTPTLHVHGQKDKIAPVVNATFSEKHAPNEFMALKLIPNENHLIPFTNPDLVVALILGII